MSTNEKREQKTIWVPKRWLIYGEPYYEKHKETLLKLGIRSATELYWRSADFGREELERLVNGLEGQGKGKKSSR